MGQWLCVALLRARSRHRGAAPRAPAPATPALWYPGCSLRPIQSIGFGKTAWRAGLIEFMTDLTATLPQALSPHVCPPQALNVKALFPLSASPLRQNASAARAPSKTTMRASALVAPSVVASTVNWRPLHSAAEACTRTAGMRDTRWLRAPLAAPDRVLRRRPCMVLDAALGLWEVAVGVNGLT